MSRNFIEYEWDWLQQRSGLRFNRFVHHDSEINKCKGMNTSQQQDQTLYQTNEECSETN